MIMKKLTEKKTTLNDLYKQGTELLEEADKENAGFDARTLLEFVLNCSTTEFMMNRHKDAKSKVVIEYLSLIRRRALGEPPQYILGEWEFMGNKFKVGKGVLIPRSETELLVDYAEKFLKNIDNPVVFDLCSGSGCIAVSVAKLFPDSTVYAVEKSEEAFGFLTENIKLNKVKNVKAILGDITNDSVLSDINADLILSNPPYIKSDDINLLDIEVRNEPRMALDGGENGYFFYNILATKWIQKLNKNGAVAVECAEDQADEISQMFFLRKTRPTIINDLSGFPRVVTGEK